MTTSDKAEMKKVAMREEVEAEVTEVTEVVTEAEETEVDTLREIPMLMMMDSFL